jgi:uncharacterized membrane protein
LNFSRIHSNTSGGGIPAFTQEGVQDLASQVFTKSLGKNFLKGGFQQPRTLLGALLGALLGMLLGTLLGPLFVPLLGTLLGALNGPLL